MAIPTPSLALDPAIKHLLHSNTAPSPSETLLPSRAARNDSLAKGLRKNKAKIAQLKRVISAVRRFPAELWGVVFGMYVAEYYTGGGSTHSAYHRRSAPMVLSRVCARRRDIVLSSPWLWDDVQITVGLAPRRTPLSSECLETIVARSAPHEFKAIIGSRTPPNPREYQPYTSSLLAQLFQTPGFVERVGHLKITMATAHYVEVPGLARQRFAALRTLHIAPRTSHSDKSVSIPDILALFADTPELRNLYVIVTKGQLAPRYHGARPAFPWAQLEVIDFQCSLDARVVLWILARTPMLREATFTSVRYDLLVSDRWGVDVRNLPQEIELRKLERLTLHGLSVVRYPALRYPVLQALMLPALTHLDLRAIQSPRDASVDLLGGLQRRSGWGLKSLAIADHLETEYIPGFLEANVGIERLEVRREDWGLFRRMRVSDADQDCASPVLLPNLRYLTVTIRDDGVGTGGDRLREAGDELTRMLASRCAEPASGAEIGCVRPGLEEVHLWIDGWVMSPESERIVRELVERGIVQDHLEREELEGEDSDE
ncbi:hypothetical protein HMN09_01405500 [Mycena chlorophos]|uniref:F-box domain-containing protein n=1 Tax=Mycena chlorophos TaxID=658473 RepID=A0A8H6RXQ9_MYCCL|nr:hypothetical protein HMN09_01405500 [Mycena chlorophos]